MCDITSDKTMNDTIRWKKSINENTHFVNGESIPCVLVQNKIDLFEKDALDSSEEELKKFAMENGYVNYFRTSCKEGIGVDESMDYLISMIIDGIMEYEEKLKGTGNKMEYTEQKSAQTMNTLNNNNSNVGIGGNGLEGKCC
jgi:50S ribosomal subunit-associated GTPase HflX